MNRSRSVSLRRGSPPGDASGHQAEKDVAAMATRAIVGEKVGMTQVWDDDNRVVPVTVLRAAVVIGHGGISWEITRQLVDHLPALVTPRWVNTLSQPIALPDVIRYLVGVLEPEEAKGRVFEIGGPEVMRYIDMLERAAAVRHKWLPNVTVPLLTPRLSSAWLALVTDVNLGAARNLVDSMITEVVVHDDSIAEVVPGETMGYDDAVRLALAERAAGGHGSKA